MFGRLTDLLCLSLLWLVLSLPVITLGAATTALYDSAARCVRGGESQPYGRFFRTFRAEFKTAALTTVLWGGVAALLYLVYRALWSSIMAGSAQAAVLTMAYYVFLFLPLGCLCWLFPLLSRFTLSFGGLNRAALQFTISHLPSTVLLVLLSVGMLGLCARFWILILIAPCTLALLWSLPMERVFRKHLPPDGEGAQT